MCFQRVCVVDLVLVSLMQEAMEGCWLWLERVLGG